MSFRPFTFQEDDRRFLEDVFDPKMRSLFLSQLSASRQRYLIAFYVFTLAGVLSVGVLEVFLGGATETVTWFSMILWLLIAFMFLAFSLHADLKYKLARAIDRLEAGGRSPLSKPSWRGE